MLLPDIEQNKVNIFTDDKLENPVEYCCLILLKFQLFLLITIL